MNMLHKTGFILSLALCLALPINAGAVDAAPVASASAEPAEAPPMSSMHDLMRDMRRDQGPEKCRMKPSAVDSDGAGTMPGMQAEKCHQGGGGKQACKENCKENCMQGGHPNCRMAADGDDDRLENLEKRMDMMQLMLEMMMRR